MKKSKVSSLIAMLIVGIMILSGCSSKESQANNTSDEKIYRIGISQLTEHPALDDARKGFEDGLKELGVNAEIDYQNAQGDISNTVSIAQKFVKDKVDLIYAIATPAAQSAKQATKDTPILFSAVTDPVKSEIVADWKNVGGNITGTSDMAPTASQLKMFKEIDPSIKTIGILYNTSEANSEIQIEEVKKLAPAEGLEVITVGISNVNELPQAIDSLLNKVDAVYNLSDNLIASSVELVSKKLIENKMISVSAEETQVKGGLLVTNGLSYYELGKQTASMAKEILVDKKEVSNIPVEVAEKTVTTVNIKTLEALGLDRNMPLFKDAVKTGE
ncbi:ABC transporter substrate-binding protein [Tissierella sp. MSJ-40]|uniref:ABC transporter substrate-binding protein n=1 Tax=Tissierella simiarum TaxID=2841534 RepID=A0ABS6E9F9_9FIRM|nr:ABC transporter substrate-binding protein [Tissierella simiarum]MBU5439176.1 ABC transporter substrate-binding protein [Tissierella simiarum]